MNIGVGLDSHGHREDFPTARVPRGMTDTINDPEVTLRTGARVPRVLVAVTTLSLRTLRAANAADPFDAMAGAIAFYEIVEKCRNPRHEFFGDFEAKFKALGLVDDNGGVHGAIRDIVLASAEGDGLTLRHVSPLAPDTA